MNNMLSQNDKKGGRQYPQWLIQGFSDVLQDYNLIDMDLSGYQFTCERDLRTYDSIEVRLNRELISPSFQNLFSDAKLINLEISTSYHFPLLLKLGMNKYVHQEKPFRIENEWLKEPYQQIFQDVWTINSQFTFYEKLTECTNVLSI
ncbi:uncharacterized protein LOC141660405 [Apium graveolens]|uniref:uncharacterized protein LOC141660405 n=1 Tax=Apium graveolens TaxID=4045 RepID=UPI003D7981B4